MTQFRPCIDLHQGHVKQIVGGSLNDQGAITHFISEYDAAHYANLYQQHKLYGGHVIALGSGNDEQVHQALKAWPQALQFGGGVNAENAASFLSKGASHVIVTSYLFDNGDFSWSKLDAIKSEVGKDNLVLDLSCRRTENGWNIATNRWQTLTNLSINKQSLQELASHCDEFLIHAADVEGLQAGIDEELVNTARQLLHHTHHLCRRSQKYRRLRARQNPIQWKNRPHHWQCTGYFWRESRHIKRMLTVE